MIDLVLIIVALLAGLAGWRQGLITSALAAVAWISGLLLGVLLTPPFLSATGLEPAQPRTTALIVLIVALVLAALLAGGARLLGGMIVRATNVRPVRLVNAGLGAVALAIASLFVSWAVLSTMRPYVSADVVRAVDDSRGWQALDGAMPGAARDSLARVEDSLEASPFPEVFSGQEPRVDVPAPDAAVAEFPAIRAARASVLKVRASSPSCNAQSVGSGWVVSPGRVVTNAHVIAGSQWVTVQSGGQGERLRARVVAFDPELDLAILSVPKLDAAPLPRASSLDRGEQAVAAGYPEGGGYTLTAARVRTQLQAVGRDVYGTKPVNREIYTLNARLLPGDSGGPLLTTQGQVAGTVLAKSVNDPDTGYALTDGATDAVLDRAATLQQPVSTGGCMPEQS